MRVTVVDCGTARLPDLQTAFRGFGCALSTVALAEVNPGTFHDAEAIVVSGGPHLFTDTDGDILIDRFAFIDRLTVPVLGICLGHQAIGIRCGASVYLGNPRRTAERIEILVRHPLVHRLDDHFELQEDHCEGITVPPGFEVIACSAHYPNEIMACDSRRLYGVQAHPEISGDRGRSLLAAFVELAGSGSSER
jgi:GMP synthase-like glutamine amidotransferase